MAGKRVASSSVDWVAFANRVPREQISQFKAFKVKCDEYIRQIAGKPDSLPKINWELYQHRIAIPGMVEEFRKQYESLTVPYPGDKYTSAINEKEKKSTEDVKKYIATSEATIAKYKEDLKFWENLMPFDEMTREEAVELFPDWEINIDKPKFWPYHPEIQPDYVPPEGAEQESHH